MILDVKLRLSESKIERLQKEAEDRHISVDEVLSEMVDEYLEDTSEEFITDFQEAFRDALAGKNLRPAREVLDEIRRELEDDAN